MQRLEVRSQSPDCPDGDQYGRHGDHHPVVHPTVLRPSPTVPDRLHAGDDRHHDGDAQERHDRDQFRNGWKAKRLANQVRPNARTATPR